MWQKLQTIAFQTLNLKWGVLKVINYCVQVKGGHHPKFFVKFDFEIAVDQKRSTPSQKFKSMPPREDKVQSEDKFFNFPYSENSKKIFIAK